MNPTRGWPLRPPGRFGVFLALLSATGAGLVLLQQFGHGVALDWDSVNYVGTARNLLSGDGFVRFDGRPYRTFPPLYPTMLAAASLFVFDPRAVAGPLNAVLLGATVFATGRWMRRRLKAPSLAVVGCLAVAFSAPLIWAGTWAMTETAFVLLSTLALIKVDESIRTAEQRRSRRCLAWAAVFAALACLCRFFGVVLVPVVVAVVGSRRSVASTERLKRIAVFAVVSCLPVCAWAFRSRVVTDTWTGRRKYGDPSLAEVLGQGVDLASGVAAYIGWLPGLLGLVAGALAIVLLALAVQGRRTGRRRPGAGQPANGASVALFGGYGLAQVVLLVPAVMWGATHQLHTRFFVPVYMSFLLAALLAVDLPRNAGSRRRRFVASVACLILVLPQAAALVPTTKKALAGFDHGYAAPRWTNSDALRYVREHGLSRTLVSNDAAAAYIHTTTPSSHRYMPCERSAWPEFLAGLGPDAHILFFPSQAEEGRAYCAGVDYDVSDLLALPGVRLVAQLADGALLKVSSSGRPVGRSSSRRWNQRATWGCSGCRRSRRRGCCPGSG